MTAPYLYDANVLLRGEQTAYGTPNPTPTALLGNVSEITKTPEWEVSDSQKRQGTIAPSSSANITKVASSASIEVANETFEDANYWLDSLFSKATSAGASAPFSRTYEAPTSTAPQPAFMTTLFGQHGLWVQMPDATVATLQITADSNGGVNFSASLIGSAIKYLSTDTVPTLPIRDNQTEMTGCKSVVSIDAWDGTMGATPIELTAFSYGLTINSNRETRGYLGACGAAAIADKKWSGELTISLEANETSKAYLDEMFGGDGNEMLKKQIQIKHVEGSGADLKEFTIQFTGFTKSAPTLFTDRDGITSYDLVFSGVYNSTFGNWLNILTKCGVETLV